MNIEDLLYLVPCALIAIVFHETAHGYLSYLLGDPTPKEQGRLTLNPIRHLNFLGIVCMIFFRFGWAKPVPVNSSYYRNPKLGLALTALAGPAVNFVLGFLSLFGAILLSQEKISPISAVFVRFFFTLASLNIGLAVFNLLPFPPLDGTKIVMIILPKKVYHFLLHYEYLFGLLLAALLVMQILDGPLTFLYETVFNAFSRAVHFLIA